MDLFKELARNCKENIFISPLSISSVLSTLLLGASGETAKQLSSLIEPNCKNLGNTVLATKVYGDWKININPSFMEKVRDKFYLVDFDHNPEKVKKAINEWVKNLTNGKILNLIDSIGVDTKLLIANAIYFNETWKLPFEKKNTRLKNFWISDSEYKPVDMMHITDSYSFGYIENIKSKILEIPYNSGCSMIVILPDNINCLSTVEEQLSINNIVNWMNCMQMAEVSLMFPKIVISESYDLRESLFNIGITKIFSEEAEFNYLTKDRNIFVSKFFHKSYIEVTEEGTEAAAATYACVADSGNVLECNFYADHPFIFLIKDDETFSILFIGRFCLP
ncbi:149R protein [Yaba-like disease virus]|uniref:149R protein n=1 Tax=Yaba-like disease virus TaxID=132475 RepID=Q9DHG4_YLDV|nr:149R protein [Yaba-like disease virus]CAC21387.1 149R protein [Yaba-like disease virus]